MSRVSPGRRRPAVTMALCIVCSATGRHAACSSVMPFAGMWWTRPASVTTYCANPPVAEASTRSPGLMPVTSAPTASTSPAHSSPRRAPPALAEGRRTARRSARFRLAARARIKTSLAAGIGFGSSRISAPLAPTTAAFTASSALAAGPTGRGAAMIARRRSETFRSRPSLRRSPRLARRIDDEPEFGDLVLDRHGVAADAAGKSALRRQRQLIERHVTAGLVDAALERVLAFERGVLGRDQTEHRHLAFRQEAQRRKVAGPRRVIFEEVAVHRDLVEQKLGDRIVAAFGDPRAGEIAATQMHADHHVGRPATNGVVKQPRVGRRQRLW